MPTDRVQLYDTTLRDGSQMEGISLSVEDKIRITRKLDELGLEWIEGGFPGSNPKDAEYFRRLRNIDLKNAKVSAFGGTRKPNITCETDANIQSLVAAETPGITLVGKASMYQVREILETSAEENLAMIADTISYFKKLGKTVFFDAEHYSAPRTSRLRLACGAGGRRCARSLRYERRHDHPFDAGRHRGRPGPGQ
mgnify:CR=1 FL=1